jgi:hypothetical protein
MLTPDLSGAFNVACRRWTPSIVSSRPQSGSVSGSACCAERLATKLPRERKGQREESLTFIRGHMMVRSNPEKSVVVAGG